MSHQSQSNKPMSFFIGDYSLFYDKEERKISSGKLKLMDFVALFDSPSDKYYAICLFEEKFPLVITKAEPKDFEFFDFAVYNHGKPLYNLSVQADKDFFVETMASLEQLKDLCHYFGFDYEQPGCQM